MRLSLRLSPQGRGRKFVAAGLIALAAAGLAILGHHLPYASIPFQNLDDLLYDSVYGLRPVQDQTGGNVVVLAVDQESLRQVLNPEGKKRRFGWPWPRETWGHIISYLNRCGARAIVFDILFAEPSPHGDDSLLAKMADASRVPVIFAVEVSPDGKPTDFAPPVRAPIFGAVNIGGSAIYRSYEPLVHDFPSLAMRVVSVAAPNAGPVRTLPFLVHYYGPFTSRDGQHTFHYVSAASIFAAGYAADRGGEVNPAHRALFGNKIVLIGGIAAGLYDVKSTPLSSFAPGVDIHATAIENLLFYQRVRRVAAGWAVLSVIVSAFLAAIVVVLPRGALWKVAGAAAVAGVLFACAIELFRGRQIYWLPLASPIIALVLATVGAFAWSYFAEDRRRRVLLKALSQYVSPEIAAEVERDPESVRLGGEERQMTVMFTDIQGFTDLSERMPVDQLTNLLNYYLGEMSSLIKLTFNGTLDKYIGDAIMSFWNAPGRQPDHAILACRAALAMERREREIQPELSRLGAPGLLTRIGVNSGAMKVGNMGSPQKFNYSVLGDAVNLGSRLEGANKFYGSRILLSQNTAEQLETQFVLRKLDLLRVKGKQQPMAVYELMAEGQPDGDLQARVAEYEAAFDLYQWQNWDQAEAKLRALLERYPGDAPAAALLSRIADLRAHPPGPDWDGVYVAKGK